MNLFCYLNKRSKKSIKIEIRKCLGVEFKEIVKENGLDIDVINNINRIKLVEHFMDEKYIRLVKKSELNQHNYNFM